MNQINPAPREEFAIVLDFLPNGYPFGVRGEFQRKFPVAQGIGKIRFGLLELAPKKGISLQPGQEVYLGEGKRDEIHHIIGKLSYSRLTETAKTEVKFILEKLIKENEQRFIQFFNEAGPINMRRHYLELLPGVGKKHMWEIIEQRKEKPFENFEDIKSRVKLLPDPEKLVMKRIISEFEENDNYHIFTS